MRFIDEDHVVDGVGIGFQQSIRGAIVGVIDLAEIVGIERRPGHRIHDGQGHVARSLGGFLLIVFGTAIIPIGNGKALIVGAVGAAVADGPALVPVFSPMLANRAAIPMP